MGNTEQRPNAVVGTSETGAHVSDHDLERYLLGMVQEPELATLEEHRLGCPTCAARRRSVPSGSMRFEQRRREPKTLEGRLTRFARNIIVENSPGALTYTVTYGTTTHTYTAKATATTPPATSTPNFSWSGDPVRKSSTGPLAPDTKGTERPTTFPSIRIQRAIHRPEPEDWFSSCLDAKCRLPF